MKYLLSIALIPWCIAQVSAQHTTPVWGWGDLQFGFGNTTAVDTGYCYGSRTSIGDQDGKVILSADAGGIYNASGVKLAGGPSLPNVYPAILPMGGDNYAVLYGDQYVMVDAATSQVGPLLYVDSINKPMVQPMRHANNNDYWLVAAGSGADSLDVYLLTADGVNRYPSFSYSDGRKYSYRFFSVSGSGNYCAFTKYHEQLDASTVRNSLRLDILKFNTFTGTFSFYNNVFKVDTAIDFFPVMTFSPNDSFLYIRQANPVHPTIGLSGLIQYNVHVANPWQTKNEYSGIASFSNWSSAMGIGGDGKLYFFYYQGTAQTHGELYCIDYPNESNPAIHLVTSIPNKWAYKWSNGCIGINWGKTLAFPPVTETAFASFRLAPAKCGYRFTNTSDNIFNQFTWYFGDGDSMVTIGKGAVLHNYQVDGPYLVRLKAVAPGGYTKWYSIDSSFENRVPVFTPLPDTSLCPNQQIMLQPMASVQDSISTLYVKPGGTFILNTWYKGCNLKDTVVLTKMDCPVSYHIPNSFSPNTDEVNDLFFINWIAPERVTHFEVDVFNRWGESVFASNDPLFSWDGKNANEGVYYYAIRIGLNGAKPTTTIKGTLYLFR